MSATGTQTASVVIVGGGILGCSIAWHLALKGETDVLVLERNDIGSGATARSAGLVARGRLHRPTMEMVRRTREAMSELEIFLDEPVGFHKVGSLRVAVSPERAAELETMDRMLGDSGVEVRQIDAHAARDRVPWLDAGQALRISLVADDGYVDGYQLTNAYARAARGLGVRIRVRTAAGPFIRRGDRIIGVQTDAGAVHADVVVDAGGAWGIGIAEAAGFALATAPIRSHYWITAPRPEWPREHPIVYLPDVRTYARPEVGGLLIGVQEPRSRTYDARTLPTDIGDFALSEPDEDWSVLVEAGPDLRPYIPMLDELALAHHITGLSTYTPDGRFLLGKAGDHDGFFVASGCCGTGVSASGGIGASLASLVLGQHPDIELADFRPARFGTLDPYHLDFRQRCAAARAGKLRRG